MVGRSHRVRVHLGKKSGCHRPVSPFPGERRAWSLQIDSIYPYLACDRVHRLHRNRERMKGAKQIGAIIERGGLTPSERWQEKEEDETPPRRADPPFQSPVLGLEQRAI